LNSCSRYYVLYDCHVMWSLVAIMASFGLEFGGNTLHSIVLNDNNTFDTPNSW
jgi:hypothetical protein